MHDIGNTRRSGGLGHSRRAFGLHRFKGLFAPGGEDADQIDRRLGAAQSGGQRFGIADIGLHRMDLADAAERLEMEGEIGTARRHANAPALARQRPHHMAADEAGAAENRDDAILGRLNIDHRRKPLMRARARAASFLPD